MGKRSQNIHQFMDSQYKLASIYARDGAFYTAAGILKDLADAVQGHTELYDPRTILGRK